MIMKTLHTIYTSFAKRLAIILTLLLTLGVTSVWGAEYEEMLVLDVAKNAPTGGITTAMDADAMLSYLENASETENEIKSVTDVTGNVYKGKGTGGDGIPQACLKIGKAKEGAGFTFTIADSFDNISKVVLVGYGWKTTTAVSVNNLDALVPTEAATEVSFEYILGTPTKTISISVATSAFCATQIILYKEAASKCAYTVTFNSNDGTNATSSQEFTCGETKALTANSFSRTGYTFAGWATSENGSVAYNDQQLVNLSSTNNDNIPLYAQWTAKTSTISFDQNDGEGGQTATVTATYDQPMPTPITLPTRYGHTFGGYYDGEGGTGTQYYTAEGASARTWDKTSADITLYAQWTEKDLTNYRTTCSTKADPNLSWSASTCIATMEVDNDFPTLTNSYDLSVNYSSSDPTIAIIDENNGAITLLKAGTTTITASYDEDEDYLSASASYTLTVYPSNCRWVEIPIEDITPEDEIVVTMGDDKTVYALGTETIDPSPKSQAITITSGMIDINQDFDYSKYTWSISAVTGGYTLQPYGTTDTYLYGLKSLISIGDNSTNNVFTIFTSPENGNKCFMYTIEYIPYYLGHGTEDGQTAWKRFESSNTLKSNTLKFYKKICLPADEYWIIYNLSNVTCTTDPIPSQIANDGEDLLLEFSANDGYKLPESISVSIGNNILPEDNDVYIWDSETGELFIYAAQVTDNITITIEGCELLAIPTNLKANNITSSSATLSWDEIDHATEYQVHITDDDDSTEDIITTTSNTYYEVTGLSSASAYLWGVTPIASGYCGITQEAEYFETLDVYTVTFNTDGGTAVESQTVDHGSKATKPANPTKTGYTFAGWYTEADTEFDFDTPITSPTTLYAKWNANQYTITFYKQSGIGGTDNATVTFNSNNYSVSTIEAPTRDKYAFGGYYTEQYGAGIQVVDAEGNWLKNVAGYTDANGNWIKAENTHLYAKWIAIYTITWVVNNNTETPYHTSTVLSGSTIDQLPTPPADDLFADCDVNAFVGWSTDNIGLEPDPTAPTDLFKTPSEAQSKIGAINGDKKFYAVYASEVEQIATFEADGLNGLSANSTLKWTHDNSGISLAISAGQRYTGSPKTFTITDGTSNYCEIVAPEGKSLKKAVVSITESDYKVNSVSSPWSLSTSNTTQTITTSTNATDLKMYATSSYQIRITQVDVTYTTYSNYITRCIALPDPVWGGATIDKTEIAVNCGETSSTNGAARISFPKETNYNLYKDITVEVTSGNFIIASSRAGEYSTSVTLSPTQDGENVGTFANKYVYVRAVAPAMSDEDFTGTITISGKQLAQDQVIEVTAEVSCTQYTLTFNDCGDTKTITDFAGTSVEEMEPWVETCSEPFQYVFDGWATALVTNGTEEYEKVDFSTFTMPNNNTTILYAVYRYAEEGGEPVNGYVKVTEALTDWSGDYVIVDDEFNVAIQNTYEEDTKDNKTLKDVSVTIKNDKIVSPTNDIIWTISKYGEYYTVYNAEAIKYAGITKNETRAAGLSETIATGYSMNIIFDSNTKIAKVSSTNYNRCFSYSESYPEWRTYSNNDTKGKTGYLYRFSNKTIRYTSSLVCGTIEAEDAIVTSTVDQTVKVYVPITLEYSDVASITGTSDNEAFTVVTKNDVAVGESNIEVHYKPTAYVNTANQEETATITLTTSKGATTTFNVTGRCLPETFAIVAKVGNIWYALPSQGLNSGTTPVGYPVEVDNNDNPTAVTSLPTKAKWALRNVYKVNGPNDRFAANGENLVFVNAENKTLYANNGNANIQTYAEYTNYAANNPDRYEWVPTTDLTNYTLKNVESAKNLSINVNATFGTHASNVASNNLRFLPINATYNPFDMQVVEWYPTKVLVQTEAALTSVSATVGGVAVASPVVTKKGGKLYEISGLPLENNPTKVLTISYDSYSCSKVIPIIISREDKTVEDAPFSTLTKDIYNYSDLVVRDGAVLNITGAKNTPDKFVNVTIYPTARIVVPENNQLSVYTLTFFGGIDEIYDGSAYTINKYGVPQLSLKGTLGKTVTTMDYIMRVDLDQMYQVGVPYDVDLADIKYWDGSAIKPGTQLYVSAYDGQARANRESKTWIWETDFAEKVLKPGIGYTISAEPQVEGDTYSILRMPMKNNIASGNTEAEKSVMVVAYDNQKDVTITDNHKGWNYLSNPYMAAISGAEADSKLVVGYLRETGTGPWEWVNDTYRYVTIPHNDGEDYYQQKFSEATLLPFKSFFLQIATDGELSFALASRQALPARLLQQENAPREVEFEILLANDTRSDNMGLLIGEDYTPAYEINADLEKMIGSMSVYTIYNGYNLAYNALSPINAQEQIPIGYVVPDVGEYTFKLDENADVENIEHIYLNDLDMNVITDLLEDEYTFYASEKKNEARFVINVIMRSEQEDDTPTGLEELDINTNHAIKFFYQDKLYILRNGIIYDAMGKQVQTINK